MRLSSGVAAVLVSLVMTMPAASAASAAPAGAAGNVDCYAYGIDDQPSQADAAHLPLELLGVPEAHELFERRGRDPGAGVSVVVVDSGVSPRAEIDVDRRIDLAGSGELVDPHGTIVAGLIAGSERGEGRLTGVAPGAEIIDVRVYDQESPQDGEVGVETDRVVAGLQWVARERRTLGDRIVVNISLAVSRTPSLDRAVRDLRRQGVVVVAASGNRPAEGEELYAEYGVRAPGQDAFEDVWPAGYEDVLTVNATAGGAPGGEVVDPLESVLPNSRTDVAVPTEGGVSWALNGSTCLVTGVATSWAAAEVSGVVALLWSWFPQESDDQILARLLVTADGTVAGRTTLTGAGVVQPVEAMTRELTVRRDGSIRRAEHAENEIPRAIAPDPRVDPLELVRQRTVWWGLLGGGALVLALLLRPILARRR